MTTAKELIEYLKPLPDDTKIIMAIDGQDKDIDLCLSATWEFYSEEKGVIYLAVIE